jgi:hypothetical protein
MSNVLIGSSNIARFYKASKFTKFRPYTLARCTDYSSFIAIMGESTEESIVISVIENFLCNRVRAEPDGDIERIIGETTQDFLATIKEAALRLPDSKFAVVMPLQRPSLPWYQDNLLNLRGQLEVGLTDLHLDNVARIDCASILTQDFVDDKVHLTEKSGESFVNFILGQSETFFKSISVDLTGADPPAPSTDEALQRRIEYLESAFKARNVSDNLVLARLREELDTTANKAREDRIIINGLVCKLPLPVEIRAKTEMLREVVTGVFNFLIPDFQGKITFVSQGKSVASPLPMVEVRLDSVENAAAVRKAFAEKSRSRLLTGDFEKLFITNSVNLATRVRIDVMKAIAKNVSSTNVKAYVVGFISRPILHVKKVLTGSHLSYTFVDSIMKYSNLIRPADLAAAYRRAGSSFDGQLQQNFVLMTEAEREECWSTSEPSSGSGHASTSFYRGRGGRGYDRGYDRGGRGYDRGGRGYDRGGRGYDRGGRGSDRGERSYDRGDSRGRQGVKRPSSTSSERAEKLSRK